ncbi:SGCD protein, partial [Polyodon spathula]|nr:SGCD protein [Polyodon spathula]
KFLSLCLLQMTQEQYTDRNNVSQEPHVYKVGIYGWRKRCLYLFVLLLMVLILVNLALTIWILKVMNFTIVSTARLVPTGLFKKLSERQKGSAGVPTIPCFRAAFGNSTDALPPHQEAVLIVHPIAVPRIPRPFFWKLCTIASILLDVLFMPIPRYRHEEHCNCLTYTYKYGLIPFLMSMRIITGSPLFLQSSKNVTVNILNGKNNVVTRLVAGSNGIETHSKLLEVKSNTGKLLFSADEREVVVGADRLRVLGAEGAVFSNSIETPHIRADPFKELR